MGWESIVAVDDRPCLAEVARGAVGLVGDEHVPPRQMEVAVRSLDLFQRSVGAEHVHRALGTCACGLGGQVLRGMDHGEDAAQVRLFGRGQ